jgi:enamine deaminase RidA (YjgF/YER057c/UK114 family)
MIEARLKELNIVLPEAGKPSHSYVRARQTGSLLYIAGHTPRRDSPQYVLGRLGAEVSIEEGRECARSCILGALASAHAYLGTLDHVTGVIKLVGYVASTADFFDQPQIINAASDLLIDIFGEPGRHARSSIGVAVLPGNVPVEIEMILEVKRG